MPPDEAAVAEGAGPSLASLPVEQVVALLRRAGCQVIDADDIRADLASGAPANRDGTLNMVSYGAWLVRELARREAHGA